MRRFSHKRCRRLFRLETLGLQKVKCCKIMKVPARTAFEREGGEEECEKEAESQDELYRREVLL